MAWNDDPPSKAELNKVADKASTPTGSWTDESPTPKELKSLSAEKPEGMLKGYARGAIEALPTAGAIGGGLLGGSIGTAAGPVGTIGGGVVGAAGGSAIGENLKELGKVYLLGDEPKQTGELYKDVAKAGGEGALSQMGGEIAGKAGGLLAESSAGKAAADWIGKKGRKLGEMLSGVPEKEIETYSKNADEITKMAKSSDNNVAEAADQMRDKFMSDIQKTRVSLNDNISNSLKQNGQNKFIDAKPIEDAIAQYKAKLNPKLHGEVIQEIDQEITGLLNKVKTENGQISLRDAQDLKSSLQELASGAYKKGGQIFNLGKDSAKAAKSAAAVTRKAMNEIAPEIAEANNKLAYLHGIEDTMNKNLLAAGKPEAGLLAAGTGGNQRNANILTKLGDATGTNMLGDAEKLAAMRTFGSPKWSAVDSTGKSAERLLKGSGIGAGIGGLIGGVPGAVAGGAVGGAMTSPAAIKAAIDSGKVTAQELKYMMSNPAFRGLLTKPAVSGGLLKRDQPNGLFSSKSQPRSSKQRKSAAHPTCASIKLSSKT